MAMDQCQLALGFKNLILARAFLSHPRDLRLSKPAHTRRRSASKCDYRIGMEAESGRGLLSVAQGMEFRLPGGCCKDSSGPGSDGLEDYSARSPPARSNRV